MLLYIWDLMLQINLFFVETCMLLGNRNNNKASRVASPHTTAVTICTMSACGNAANIIKWSTRVRFCYVDFRMGIVSFGQRTRIRGVGIDAKEIPVNLLENCQRTGNGCLTKFPNTCFVWPHSPAIHMTPICPVNLISLLLFPSFHFSPSLLDTVSHPKGRVVSD